MAQLPPQPPSMFETHFARFRDTREYPAAEDIVALSKELMRSHPGVLSPSRHKLFFAARVLSLSQRQHASAGKFWAHYYVAYAGAQDADYVGAADCDTRLLDLYELGSLPDMVVHAREADLADALASAFEERFPCPLDVEVARARQLVCELDAALREVAVLAVTAADAAVRADAAKSLVLDIQRTQAVKTQRFEGLLTHADTLLVEFLEQQALEADVEGTVVAALRQRRAALQEELDQEPRAFHVATAAAFPHACPVALQGDDSEAAMPPAMALRLCAPRRVTATDVVLVLPEFASMDLELQLAPEFLQDACCCCWLDAHRALEAGLRQIELVMFGRSHDPSVRMLVRIGASAAKWRSPYVDKASGRFCSRVVWAPGVVSVLLTEVTLAGEPVPLAPPAALPALVFDGYAHGKDVFDRLAYGNNEDILSALNERLCAPGLPWRHFAVPLTRGLREEHICAAVCQNEQTLDDFVRNYDSTSTSTFMDAVRRDPFIVSDNLLTRRCPWLQQLLVDAVLTDRGVVAFLMGTTMSESFWDEVLGKHTHTSDRPGWQMLASCPRKDWTFDLCRQAVTLDADTVAVVPLVHLQANEDELCKLASRTLGSALQLARNFPQDADVWRQAVQTGCVSASMVHMIPPSLRQELFPLVLKHTRNVNCVPHLLATLLTFSHGEALLVADTLRFRAVQRNWQALEHTHVVRLKHCVAAVQSAAAAAAAVATANGVAGATAGGFYTQPAFAGARALSGNEDVHSVPTEVVQQCGRSVLDMIPEVFLPGVFDACALEVLAVLRTWPVKRELHDVFSAGPSCLRNNDTMQALIQALCKHL